MEVKAYFSDIHKVIIKQLEGAESHIHVAVAWFTDKDIFDVLCKKAQSGIKVSLVLVGDDINCGAGRLNFVRLENLGAKVTFLPTGSQDTSLMHHKFCVIDAKTVITGSYNWSKKARSNDENITIMTDSQEFASKYLHVFEELCTRVGQGGQKATSLMSADAVKRRLEMIRNLILLGDYEDVNAQIVKLNPIADEYKLSSMIELLNKGQYQEALEQIKAYLSKFTALITIEDQEIPQLQFELQILELRLESLSNEKAEIERCLIVFNQRHDDALGHVIQDLLQTRAIYARLIALTKENDAEQESAQAEAEEAESTYQRYSKQHEQLQQEAHVPKLDKEQEKELKALYRKACSFCHPDKASEDKKQMAHDIFTTLLDAYKSNDLEQVRQIYERVKNGDFTQTRATTLSKVEVLKTAIAEIKYQLDKLLTQLQHLQASQAVQLMQGAGTTEVEWQQYFDGQQSMLLSELEKIKAQIEQLENGVT
ncbi:MAG: DUF1669 domain-containing protein [Acinetobacter sp.]|nr:DUF1669 domain-containing protein [Acinetobacter sp.]